MSPSCARTTPRPAWRSGRPMARYTVNRRGVAHARSLIDAKRYVLDSDWGEVQPGADETKARYAFVCGDFRRVHRTGLIACVYRAMEWRHKDVERAAYRLLQHLDRVSGITKR